MSVWGQNENKPVQRKFDVDPASKTLLKEDGVLIFVCIEEKDISETTKKMADKIFNFKMLDGPNGINSVSLKNLQEEV